MTDRSIPSRIAHRYRQLANLTREVWTDLRVIATQNYRGAVVLMAVAFWVGAWIG